MKLYKVLAVVLNSRQMRDAHRILTLFSKERGKIKVVAHGVAKPTSRKRGAVQPFSVTDFLLRRGRELDSISQCEGREFFPGLVADLDKMLYAGHVAELVDALTMDGDPHGDVFVHIVKTLRELDKTADPELVARWFEMQLMAMLGYLPGLSSCVNCGGQVNGPIARFSARAGGLVCSRCAGSAGGISCNRGTVAVMQTLLNWDINKINRLRVSQSCRFQMRAIMREYLQWHMEKLSRSLQFMDKLNSFKPGV
ncbi:DNA repair protein RecO [Desulfallas thermosapovorans]|uniref:DNA repair protein RecO n=1 Tax=Desulfallas thermosapovorans DSM 6562 TaxID=1121431 RepID=A0A5S4ZWM2_9FIRM|nr:DNA repair protein RecO [Desulfallas thermosapovorans]TYO97272.1 DNA replication and repair protein RecO [Desulfallas thermosapovorans DSM 6562]